MAPETGGEQGAVGRWLLRDIFRELALESWKSHFGQLVVSEDEFSLPIPCL